MSLDGVSLGCAVRALVFAIALGVSALAQGCATTEEPKVKDDVVSLKSQFWDMQKRTAQLELAMSEQINEVAFLSERIKAIEAKPSAGRGSGQLDGAGMRGRYGELAPEEVYKISMIYFNRGKMAQAAVGFVHITSRFGEKPIAGRAQFWLGETFYIRKQYVRAIDEYRKVLTRHPVNPKTADAMYKIGLSNIAMERVAEGEKTLARLIKKYPDTSSAMAARKKLGMVSEEKHEKTVQ